MNAVKKLESSQIKKKSDANVLSELSPEEKKAAEDRFKAYLNEKLYYFYNNSGPIMDI